MPSTRNRKWSKEELTLALDLYWKIGIGDDSNAEVIALSELLNQLSASMNHIDPERFRNPNSVSMKLSNFARLDPNYSGSGMKNGNKLEPIVWDEFVNDRVALKHVVLNIKSSIKYNELFEVKKSIGGQGFRISSEERKALELAAMESSIDYYRSKGWNVTDVSANHPYDLKCIKNVNEELHVEVKGTTTDGSVVLLTPGEVKHASKYPRMELFILHDISLNKSKSNELSTTGGTKTVISPWDVSHGDLKPIGYEYSPIIDNKNIEQ